MSVTTKPMQPLIPRALTGVVGRMAQHADHYRTCDDCARLHPKKCPEGERIAPIVEKWVGVMAKLAEPAPANASSDELSGLASTLVRDANAHRREDR